MQEKLHFICSKKSIENDKQLLLFAINFYSFVAELFDQNENILHNF